MLMAHSRARGAAYSHFRFHLRFCYSLVMTTLLSDEVGAKEDMIYPGHGRFHKLLLMKTFLGRGRTPQKRRPVTANSRIQSEKIVAKIEGLLDLSIQRDFYEN